MSSFVRGNHVYEQVVINTWLVRLNFTPRPAGAGSGTTFQEQLNGATGADMGADAKTDSINTGSLTAAQKEALLERLHNGQGDLTLQEWDDFLADLVDLGIITNSERMHANGVLCSFPDSTSHPDTARGGVSVRRHSQSQFDMMDSWAGDPLKWLDNLDLFLLKEIRYAELDGYGTSGLSSQRADCSNIARIMRELLAGNYN